VRTRSTGTHAPSMPSRRPEIRDLHRVVSQMIRQSSRPVLLTTTRPQSVGRSSAETTSQGFLSLDRGEQFGVVHGPVHRTLESMAVVVMSVDNLSEATSRAVLQPSGRMGNSVKCNPEGLGTDSAAPRGL